MEQCEAIDDIDLASSNCCLHLSRQYGSKSFGLVACTSSLNPVVANEKDKESNNTNFFILLTS
jgi:hypothetical protein